MHNDSTDSYNASNSKRTGVAHEYLGRIGVIPQETNHGTYKGT